MHIPSSASQCIELLSFEEALALSGQSGGYDTDKWIYIPDFYTEYNLPFDGIVGRSSLPS